MDNIIDRPAILLARLTTISKLPLGDRDAIPHKYFMELSAEFLELLKELKTCETTRSDTVSAKTHTMSEKS